MAPNFKETDVKKYGISVQKPKKKKVKISTLKKKVWLFASPVLRKLDCIARGNGDYVKCVTCPETKHWKEFDAGHFVSAKHNILTFDERNVHCQCRRCNSMLHGNMAEYMLFMQRQYGKDTAQKIWDMRLVTKQFTQEELEEQLQRFKKLQEELHIL